MKPIKPMIRKISDVLIKMYPITSILALIWAAIIIVNADFLSKKGIYFAGNVQGDSMYPLIKEGALLLIADDTAAPFDDLQEGDIVIYRERTNTVPMKISLTPTVEETDGSSDGPVVFSSKTVTITPGLDSQDGTYTDEGAEYNSGNYILHQIIKVNEADEDGDRVIFTRGINNSRDDPKATLKSGYFGKLLWHMNGIGPIYNFFILGPGFIILGVLYGLTLVNYYVRAIQSYRESKKAAEYARSRVPSVSDKPDNPDKPDKPANPI